MLGGEFVNNEFIVSVITPFFKGNKYLKQLFSVMDRNYSILKYEYPQAEMELLIVNDSPDTSVKIPEFSVNFKYKIINHELNSGIQQARVTGLKNCSGDYVLFLDQDDELLNNAIENQARILIDTNADMVICNAYVERADGSSYLCYKTKTDFNKLNDLKFYLKSHNVIKSPGQCLIRKDCIPVEWQEYIIKRNGSDDLFLWILLFEKSTNFVINREPLYIHKYTGENLSESEEKMNISSLEIVEFLKKVDYVPQKDIDELKRARDFSLDLRKNNSIGKIKVIIKNIDLFLYLGFNKIKKILF